jgi:DNA-binding NarL/FixJ family response regulator
MLTVLIVDDHSIVRQGMINMLTTVHPDWQIIEAENGVQAILAAARFKPDLILMDHMMPKLDGIRASSAIKKDQPASIIIMVTMSNREEILPGATEAGVTRLIPKDAPYSEIIATITELSDAISKKKPKSKVKSPRKKTKVRKAKADNHTDSFFFTDREMEVIGLMMKGKSSVKISDYLGISSRTVEGHKLKIMKKCDVHSYQEFFSFVVRNKIIPVL